MFTELSLFRPDQVYVSGLPKDVTEEDIETHFGSIGMLKVDKKRDGNKKKIWLYRDKASGELKVHMPTFHFSPSSKPARVTTGIQSS